MSKVSVWKKHVVTNLTNQTHLECICMRETIEVSKTHPEWLRDDSEYFPCEYCGTWTNSKNNSNSTMCDKCFEK